MKIEISITELKEILKLVFLSG